MNDFNKKNLFWGVKMIAVTLMILIAIATNVEIWNMFTANVTDLFHLVVSIINFIFEATILGFCAVTVFKSR